MTLLRRTQSIFRCIKNEVRSTHISSNLYSIHRCQYCTDRTGDNSNDTANFSENNTVAEKRKEQMRIPRRILRKIEKLKSESPDNSEIKLFLGNKEANIKQILSDMETPPAPNQKPEFPSDNDKYLHWYQSQSRKAYRPKIDPMKTSILLFPGQGSQFVGMGKKLLPYPGVKEIYDIASEILNYDLLKFCLFGPKSDLDKTIYCQPAVMVTSIAAIEKLKEDHPEVICSYSFNIDNLGF